MYIFRLLKQNTARVRNKISALSNLLIMKMLGVKHGSNCLIHGRVSFKIHATGKMKVGNDFYYSSGHDINPLSSNIHGCVFVGENAEVTIGNNVGLSSTVIWAHKSIKIGNNVRIGGLCTIIDSDSHSLNYKDRRELATDKANTKSSPIVIEDDVMIGMRCIILKGVTIGARSVIGAGSIVTKDIPSDSIAVGNPAKVIKHID